MRRLLYDNKARIPFAILGVFLLLGSSCTTTIIIALKMERTSETSSLGFSDEIKDMIKHMESDISSKIVVSGLKAVKEIGENPVILSADSSKSANEINIDRLKNRIIGDLKEYISNNYMNNCFTSEHYTTNILEDKNLEDKIFLKTLDMKIRRPISIPFISPSVDEKHPVYWYISIPFTIEIISHDNHRILDKINVSTVIPSRYPLLESLTNEFSKAINGTNSLWSIITILSNIYTLARGYQQYTTGEPLNIVDNHHLTPLVNMGLLLDEFLFLGGVDPIGIIETIKESSSSLRNQSKTSILNSIDEDSYSFSISPEGSSTISSPMINISEIADNILYNYNNLRLSFEKNGNQIAEELSDTNNLNETINSFLEDGYSFLGVEKNGVVENISTIQQVNSIISKTYTSTLETRVERSIIKMISGSHNGYNIDNGIGNWILQDYKLVETHDKPLNIHIDSILYEEIYNVTYRRDHQWYNLSSNSSIIVSDYKIEQVKLEIILDRYSYTRKDDTIDIFYWNTTLNDPNLAGTLIEYKNSFFKPNITELIVKENGIYNTRDIIGMIPSWVSQKSWEILEEILENIKSIHINEKINTCRYPNPFDLIENARKDFLEKYNENLSRYKSRDSYLTGNLFKSIGMKAIYNVRDWYTDYVISKINETFSSLTKDLQNQINDKVSNKVSSNNVFNILSSGISSEIGNQIIIPFSKELTLRRDKDSNNLGWNEYATIAITHKPHYLDPFHEMEYNGKKKYWFGIRNTCIFGSTGLPILPPTTVTPWVLTLNTWLIEVKGVFAEFKLLDTNDETIYSPLFGHQPQVYIRKEATIRDENGNILGWNKNIEFEFTTIAFSVVPPWGTMVGDRDGSIIETNGLYLN